MRKLQHEDADWLRRRIAPMLRFIGRVRVRLERRGYTPQHSLYRAINAAYDAMQALHVAAHYESCEGGVGRPSDAE